MRRLPVLLLIVMFAISLSGCNSGGGEGGSASSGGSAGSDESTVTLLFDFGDDMLFAMNDTEQDIMLAKLIDFITMAKEAYAAHLYDYITSLYIKVTGSGMSNIIHTEDITDPSSSLSVSLTVPNGSARKFEVKLKDRNGNILYSGDLIIDVGNGGASQDITVNVNIDDVINADDYVAIGRGHLEGHKLELAFIAFDTAVCIDEDRPVANFFRGFTKLLLLVQKDDPDADVTSPNADIASMLNLYANLGDIYTSSIAPDIYNENYDEDLEKFYDNDWVEPPGVTTDTSVNVIENVILPEIENVISDLANAEADEVFYTTLTTNMHFGIDSTIKVDRGDVYVLEAIAYALKAYYNHILAYRLRTDANYWKDEFDRPGPDSDNGPPYYRGLQNIINDDPGGSGEELLDFVGGADTYLSAAKAAYSNGLDKLEAGLQFIKNPLKRNSEDKKAENHVFNVVDVEDSVLVTDPSLNKANISNIINTIDDVKTALDKSIADPESDVRCYDEYDSAITTYDTATVNLPKLFSSSTAPYRNTRPEFYYHEKSDTDLPVFDTNDTASSSAFIQVFTDTLTELDGQPIDTLEDALQEELLPSQYKFGVPQKTIAMTGNRTDFTGAPSVSPVMFDKEEGEKNAEFDLMKVYMAKDASYLYIGMRFRGDNPYGPYGEGPVYRPGPEEWVSYHVYFNAKYSDCGWYSAPVCIELHGYYDAGEVWDCRLYSRAEQKQSLSPLEGYCKVSDIVEFKIPLNELATWIKNYQVPGETWEWDEEEVYVAVSVGADISSTRWNDCASECLAKLN